MIEIRQAQQMQHVDKIQRINRDNHQIDSISSSFKFQRINTETTIISIPFQHSNPAVATQPHHTFLRLTPNDQLITKKQIEN